MKTRFTILIVAVLMIHWATFDSAAYAQTKPKNYDFAHAIKNESTSPFFVLITVVDSSSDSSKLVCTTANLLLGAIHLEYNLSYDSVGTEEAERIALSNKHRLFRFTKSEALDNIPIKYGKSDIEKVRKELSNYSRKEIGQMFVTSYDVNTIQEVSPVGALAHVLIELGFSVFQADITGQVYIDVEETRENHH